LTAPESVDLTQPRTLGPLLTDALRVYFRHFLTFTVVGFVVVAPAQAIVSGVGLGQFSKGYDSTPPLAASTIPLAVQALVTSPLIAAMCVYLLTDLSESRPVSAWRAIQRGLDAFGPVFVPVLTALAAEALLTILFVVPLALALGFAFVPTVILPVILAVRWYFAPQAVVVGGARRLQALRDSWELTRAQGWRVAGIVFLVLVTFQTASGLLSTPLVALARSADSGALLVASDVFGQTLATPAVAVVAAFLFYDLRARRRVAAERGVS
jgi:hypothetical protein